MFKKDFARKIKEISEEKGTALTLDASIKMIDTIAEAITEALVAGEEVELPGVVKFGTKTQAAKTGMINFGDRKGEMWESPEKRVPALRVSSTIKNKLNA